MKINHLIAFLLLLATTSCASTRKSAEIDPPFVASESTWLYRDVEVVNRHLKPLERLQVRFEIEHAILHGDSVWVVARATIPHRSIRRGKYFKATCIFQAPEGIMELGELIFDSGHFMPDEEGDVNAVWCCPRFVPMWDKSYTFPQTSGISSASSAYKKTYPDIPLALPK